MCGVNENRRELERAGMETCGHHHCHQLPQEGAAGRRLMVCPSQIGCSLLLTEK